MSTKEWGSYPGCLIGPRLLFCVCIKLITKFNISGNYYRRIFVFFGMGITIFSTIQSAGKKCVPYLKVMVHHFRRLEVALMATSRHHWHSFSSSQGVLNLSDSRKTWLKIAKCLFEPRILDLKKELSLSITNYINKYLTRL